MVIYFLTTQSDACKLITSRLEQHGHFCTIFTGHADFFSAVLSSPEKPDLLACDYFSFSSKFFNPYEVLTDIKVQIPYFTYNEPFPDENSRCSWWLKEIQNAPFHTAPSEYRSFFEQLQEILSCNEIKVHIRGITPPLPLNEDAVILPDKKCSDKKINDKESETLFLHSFRRRQKISRMVFSLFCFLFANQQEIVTMNEISDALTIDSSRPSVNSIRVSLSKLRQHLEEDDIVNMEIVREGTGYRLVSI